MPSKTKYLIIGAGPCGLALAKAFKTNGIKYHQAEATSKIGGNWSHGVYDTVFTDASKQVMQFSDYPMPASYPDFLSKKHMLDYLNSYCDHFQLESNILFDTKVTWLQAEGNEWIATFNNEHQERYTGVVVCNGHHWDMKFPELKGHFEGEYLHSKEYKNPSQLVGKKVLVIGAGNSAADIACEAARVGASSTMSIRNSPWIFPKSFAGVPLGNIKLRKAPSFLGPIMLKLLIKFTFGKHEYYGLETPKHDYVDKHPTVSEELPYYLKHGRINLRKGIDKISGTTVTFTDGIEEQFDLLIAATGYHLSFPFLPKELQRVEGQHLKCVGYCTYPDYKGLYLVGWPQVRGGIGSLASAFSQVVTDLVSIEEEFGIPAGQVLEACGNTTSDTHLYGSKEVFQWMKKHTLKKLEKVAKKLCAQSFKRTLVSIDDFRLFEPVFEKPLGHTRQMDHLYQKLEREYFVRFDFKLRYLLAEYSMENLVTHIIKWLKDLDEKDVEAEGKYRYTLIFARDLFIGSDLSKEEKKTFYQTLKAAGFFQSLSGYLYSNNQGFCSYAIYTIGKFSHLENAQYLEQAYEEEYRSVDPSLSCRCLSELSWLGSSQLPRYIDDLKNEGSTLSKLTLALFFRSRSDTDNKYNDLIADPDLVNFIAPHKPNTSRDELETRLMNFDMQTFNSAWSGNKHTRAQRLEDAASKFFKEFIYSKPENDEEYQNLLRALGTD